MNVYSKPHFLLVDEIPLALDRFCFFSSRPHKSSTLDCILAQLHFSKTYIPVKAFPTEAANV